MIKSGEHWAIGKAMGSDDFKDEPFTRRVGGASRSVRTNSHRSATLREDKALARTASVEPGLQCRSDVEVAP